MVFSYLLTLEKALKNEMARRQHWKEEATWVLEHPCLESNHPSQWWPVACFPKGACLAVLCLCSWQSESEAHRAPTSVSLQHSAAPVLQEGFASVSVHTYHWLAFGAICLLSFLDGSVMWHLSLMPWLFSGPQLVCKLSISDHLANPTFKPVDKVGLPF